ncbi:hypothetical protein NL676_007944 [Syzygium grande]|nr:hypothetical protein NL676_007944 [Syzygium grande]
MSTQKRASASTALNQPNQPKRPRDFRIKQERSCLTEEDVRRVIKEELEHAKSHSGHILSKLHQQRSRRDNETDAANDGKFFAGTEGRSGACSHSLSPRRKG